MNLNGQSGTFSTSNPLVGSTTTDVNFETSSSDTSSLNQFGYPVRLEVKEVGDTIEMIYKETSNLCYTSYPSPPPEERVFKIVYSCQNGKWNKSEPIYGEIVPSKDEYYEF